MDSPYQARKPEDQDQELSLKAVILTVQGWISYLWSKKIIILLFALVGGALGLTYAYKKKTTYKAELTFVMEDNASNPLGAYMGMASQFGIDLSGGSGSGIFEGDNIMVFLKSRLMIEKTLLSPIVSDRGKITLAEKYIEYNGLRNAWSDPAMKALHFPLGQQRSSFTLKQDSILQIIYNNILNTNLNIDKTAKQYNFISVTCTTLDESFSKTFTESLVNEAVSFYVDTKTKKVRANLERLQRQADSLEILLNRKTYSAAATQDLNLNPAKQVAGVNLEFALRDKMVLQTMYGEVIKNLEYTKISMEQETPVIQIIDIPIYPLKKIKLGRLMGIVLGGFMGGVIIVFYLICRKILNDIIKG